MNRSLVAAAALVAGIAIAAPMLAWSADTPPAAAPDMPRMPGMMMKMHDHEAGPGGMGGMHEHQHGMGRPGGMREMMMHRMAQLSPRQRCEERLARRAGRVAYTMAKLDLTAEQRPLWDKLQSLTQAAGDRERQLCGSLPSAEARSQETILDRMNRREQFLSARLQGLRETRPALEQLYQALSPEQRVTLNHPFPHR